METNKNQIKHIENVFIMLRKSFSDVEKNCNKNVEERNKAILERLINFNKIRWIQFSVERKGNENQID